MVKLEDLACIRIQTIDPQTIPFTVEGISSPKIVMEIDDSCYKYAGSGNIKVITLKDNSKVDDGQAPQFNVKVSGGSEGLDNASDSEVDPGKKYELELDDTRDKQRSLFSLSF